MDALSPAFDPADDVIAPADVETRPAPSLTHLEQLEAESVHIIREAVAESENPVMLYSIVKDSSVLLHLALKASIRRSRRFPVARRHDLEISRDDRISRCPRPRARPRSDRARQSGRIEPRHQSS